MGKRSGKMRTERDSLGTVQIPEDKLWGAQSQRSQQNFCIGNDRFPNEFIHDFALVKKAAALINCKLGDLAPELTELITAACDEIASGKHDEQFLLSVWQTGSGTQTNMNLNEVIANIGNIRSGSTSGSNTPLHPNDHVNRSQSSNDIFPTVMHVSTTRLLRTRLLPALADINTALLEKQAQFDGKIKTGRTHMMDATPITLGQEFGAFVCQLEFASRQLHNSLQGVSELAIGGTAVGTGLNTRPEWAELVTQEISRLCGFGFVSAANKFAQLAAHDALLNVHSALNLLATALLKLGNDIRMMNSGPRCGLSEIRIPANEPGSSIMPGKVNPTQVEALTMVCVRVMGNQTTIGIAASQGQFQLNVYKPLIIHVVMESIGLLTDAINSFTAHCLRGIEANDRQLKHYMERSLMLVTALSPHIGYDKAAQAAKLAQESNLSLRDAVLQLKFLEAEDYDRLVRPDAMLGSQARPKPDK
jgi:fumarate hydratase class II